MNLGCLILFVIFSIVCIIGIFIYNNCGARYKYSLSVGEVVGMSLTIIGCLVGITCLLLSIFLPISAKEEYAKFVEAKTLSEQLVNNTSEYTDAGLTGKLLDCEPNEWLREAKASKYTYGIFSSYYWLDVEDLDYIIDVGALNEIDN